MQILIGNPLPSLRIKFRLKNSSLEKINPMEIPSSQKISPPKMFVYFVNTRYYLWTMGKVCNLQPFPQGLWGLCNPKRHSYSPSQPCRIKWLSQNFIGCLWGKMDVRGGGVIVFRSLWSLRKGTRTMTSIQISPPQLSRTIDSIRRPLGKKTASVIFLLAKNTKSQIFVDRSLCVNRFGTWQYFGESSVGLASFGRLYFRALIKQNKKS